MKNFACQEIITIFTIFLLILQDLAEIIEEELEAEKKRLKAE